MTIRPTQTSTFSLVARGLTLNFLKLATAQERVATGKSILRPSDDAVGTARAMSMRRQIGQLSRFRDSVDAGQPVLETSTSALEEASGILSEARSLLVTAMSGSMNPTDREAIGLQIELILEKLVDVANSKLGDRYLFAGTKTSEAPFELTREGTLMKVDYKGNEERQNISIGFGTEIALNIPGSEIFGSPSVQSVDFAGLTGLALGPSASQGEGFADVELRHDATVGALGSGLALVSGGALDTVLGAHTLVVDSGANTVTLDGGLPHHIPDTTDPDFTDFVVTDENGAELHLDFSAYDHTHSVSAVDGQGSISLDGSTYSPLTFTETDLELLDTATGTVLHVDATGVRRAGNEAVSFAGNTDIFSVLASAAHDLRNGDGLPPSDVVDRVQLRFAEFERNFDRILKGLGTLGAHTERLLSSGDRLESLSLNVEGLLSQVEDTDLAQVVLEMTKSEQTLQVAQATGSRLIQNSLLNYLR
ncbi:MAG: flagellar hook-associated protein FlgL [Planctomycetes bacterium]|nr:flagellar hook-associated protein FlgL [Planctomycetota bacterium]